MVVVESETPEDVLMIMHNLQRVKTPKELLHESQYHLRLIPKQQGKRTDLIDEPEDSMIESMPGDRYKKVEELMGGVISDQTVRRMDRLVEAEEQAKKAGNTEYLNLGLLDRMAEGKISPSHAVNLLDTYKKNFSERESERSVCVDLPETHIPSFTLYRTSSERMEELQSSSIQTVFTSCPYYQARDYSNGTSEVPELGQDKTPDIFIDRLLVHFTEVHRVLKEEGSFFLNIGEFGIDKFSPLITNKLLVRLCEEIGFKCVNEIIFHKTNGKPSSVKRRLGGSYEKVFHLVKNVDLYYYQPLKVWRDEPMILMPGFRNKGPEGINFSKPNIRKPYQHFKDFIDEQYFEDVIKSRAANPSFTKKIDSDFEHPAVFDPKLSLLGILTTSKPGDCVLDPFSGTASCGEMALMLGRQYVGYECNQDYHDFAEKRIPFTTKGYDEDSVWYFEGLKNGNNEPLKMAS